MKESLRSPPSRSGTQTSRPQPSGMSSTMSQGSNARRPRSPFRVKDLVFDEAGKNLLSSDKGYAAAKAAQAAQRSQATREAQTLPQGPSASNRAITSGPSTARHAPSNVSQDSNSGKIPKAYRDPNPSHVINEGPPMRTQPPGSPFKSSPWNSAKVALFGEDSLYVDNGRDDYSDRREARDRRAHEARSKATKETRDRSNSITSVLSGLKSGLKAAFGSSASLRSLQKGKRAESSPPNAGYPDMNKKDWEEYYARQAKFKAKISKPIPNGPIFETDHVVGHQQKYYEQSKHAQQPKQARARTQARKTPSNVTIKTAEMKSFKEMKASPGGYIKHNDFQKHNHKPSIARGVVRPQSDWKLSVDKALENLHLKHKDSDESFSNSPVPRMELKRVCNGCGKALKNRGMDPYSAYMCDYCANKQKRGEREPIDTRPTNKDWANTRWPVSPAIDDGEPDRWDRPITALYDDTDISSLLPPDTIPDKFMQKRVLIHPASANQTTNLEDRYSAVNIDLSPLLPPETLYATPRPFDTASSSLRRKPSERVHQKPQNTKSAFLHDMGNPFDRKTMVAPLPALPPPLPPQIPMKPPPRLNNNSAATAVKAGKPSPLTFMTQENHAKWKAMKADPKYPVPQTPNDMSTDAPRDTRFYDFYDDVLKSDSERGTPPKDTDTRKGRN